MSMKKIALIACGFIALFLGVIGIFLPLLPTTPFLLLSAGCFLRSSKRLYLWLTNHKLFGKYIKNYLEHSAMTKMTKAVLIIFLWVTISLTILFAIEKMWLRIVLFGIGCGVSIHLLMMKTLKPQAADKMRF